VTDLYLVYVRDPAPGMSPLIGGVELEPGLYLVRTDQTRSQLYHAIKRRVSPSVLLVAPLSDLPKFKGMRQGAAKAVGFLREIPS
jgi:hypothetical protein